MVQSNANANVYILVSQVAEEEEERICWSGGPLHQINLSNTATKWEKVCQSFKQTNKKLASQIVKDYKI